MINYITNLNQTKNIQKKKEDKKMAIPLFH